MRRSNIGTPPRPAADTFEQWLVQALFEIQKASHDESLSDLATLKRSVGKTIVGDGKQWTLADLPLAAEIPDAGALPYGSEDEPALRFANDPGTGFYLFSDGVLGVTVGGALIGAWTSGGYDGPIGQGTPNVGDFTALTVNDVAVALAAGDGLLTQTATGTFAAREIAVSGAGLAITNGGGVADNPTLALANDVAAIEALTGEGLAYRTGAEAWQLREQLWETIRGHTTFSGVASISEVDLDAFISLRLRVVFLCNAASSTQGFLRTSSNNGSSFDAGASDYSYNAVEWYGTASLASASTAGTTGIPLAIGEFLGIGAYGKWEFTIDEFNKGTSCLIVWESNYYGASTGRANGVRGIGWRGQNTARNAIQLVITAGATSFQGYYTLEGIRG